MHLRKLTSPLALLIMVVSPLALRAQFQQPTEEELKMTADPKAPGAEAVYLNIEEVDDDPHHYQSFYERIKVLTEKGKDLATVELPYLRANTKITDIKGRTIHADGTVIPMEIKPEDLLISKSGSKQIDRKVFNLPDVQVGSILEYSYQLRYDDDRFSSPYWHVQRKFYAHKEHYAFTPFRAFLPGIQNATSSYLVNDRGDPLNQLLYWHVLPAGAEVQRDATGRFTLDVADVPAEPKEEWMPPLSNTLYKVDFYYTSAHSAGNYWQDEAKHWSSDLDHFAEPTKTIRAAVDGLVAPGDSDLDKAKKLYKAVQALDNTDFSRKKSSSELKQLKLKTARHADDTWTQKSGSSEDITLLYLAMLRAAGLTAYAMRVVDRDRGVFEPRYLNFDQLDDDIVLLSTGGKEIVLDPGEKMCPFQTVHWRHSGAGGVRQSANGLGASTSPLQSYLANSLVRTADLTLDEQGGVEGSLRFVMTGQESLRWRQDALVSDESDVKKSFDQWIETMMPEGVEAHIDHFIALQDEDLALLAVIKVQGNIGSSTSKRLLLPGFFFATRSDHPFVQEDKRQTLVDMHYGSQTKDEVVYHLPAGFTVESTPKDDKISWPERAILGIKSTQDGSSLTVGRTLARAFTFAKPEEYQSLHDFYQKVAVADQQQIVLTKTPAAKGN